MGRPTPYIGARSELTFKKTAPVIWQRRGDSNPRPKVESLRCWATTLRLHYTTNHHRLQLRNCLPRASYTCNYHISNHTHLRVEVLRKWLPILHNKTDLLHCEHEV